MVRAGFRGVRKLNRARPFFACVTGSIYCGEGDAVGAEGGGDGMGGDSDSAMRIRMALGEVLGGLIDPGPLDSTRLAQKSIGPWPV